MRSVYLLTITVLLGYGVWLMWLDLSSSPNPIFPVSVVVGLGWALTAMLNLLSWWYGSRAPHARYAAVAANLVFAVAAFLDVGLSSRPLGIAALCFAAVAFLPGRKAPRAAVASR